MKEIDQLRAQNSTLTRLLITVAAHSQGGNSLTGAEIAGYLDIPFPLTMENLSKAAIAHGLDPDQLWPWLRKMRDERGQ